MGRNSLRAGSVRDRLTLSHAAYTIEQHFEIFCGRWLDSKKLTFEHLTNWTSEATRNSQGMTTRILNAIKSKVQDVAGCAAQICFVHGPALYFAFLLYWGYIGVMLGLYWGCI